MLKIYGFPTFNVSKVLITAEEVGLEYEYVSVDPTKGETKTPEHYKRHPLGKAPVIEHDGNYVIESAAISRYLARLQDSDLYKGSAQELARIDAWIDMITLHTGRHLATCWFQEVIVTSFYGKDPDAEALAEARGFLDEQLPVVEKQLSEHSYLAGDKITLADLLGFSVFNTHEDSSVSLDDYPSIKRWYDEIKARPSVGKALAHFPGGSLLRPA